MDKRKVEVRCRGGEIAAWPAFDGGHICQPLLTPSSGLMERSFRYVIAPVSPYGITLQYLNLLTIPTEPGTHSDVCSADNISATTCHVLGVVMHSRGASIAPASFLPLQ